MLTNERTVTRKLKELILSLQLERKYSKNEILARYLNTIPYGNNAYGVEMAARIYFGKNAKNLSLAEATILASLPQAPSRYNPYGNGKELLMGAFNEEGDYVTGRKDLVLRRMVDLEYISQEEREKAFEEATDIEFSKYRENIKYPHMVLYIKELLENKFGKEAVETGGLKVYTTLDPKIQDRAEEIITERIATYPDRYGATNASVLTVDTEKGHILAMVGSADYFNEEIDGNVNIVFRQRLPGSSFKPLVYAAGFAKGYSPATIFYDLETDFGNNYIPQNYDGNFMGPVSARRSLARSLNIPAVKMAFLAGADNVVNQAKKMGLTDLIDGDQYGTSIGLGTGEATLYQMVTAYSVFARGGKKISFTPFLRIETADGKIIESNEDRIPKEKEVLDPQIAYSINHILSDASSRPAGWEALQVPDQINGAKTGTSNKRIDGRGAYKDDTGTIRPLDNWTIGYTTKIVTGVWVGNNDASPLNFNAAGLTTAAPIWNAVMQAATEDHDLEEFPKPEGIEWMKVSKWSGLLPSEHTAKEDVVAELFTQFNTPTESDQTFLSVEIDKVSKKLPTEFTPEDAKVQALVANFKSLNPTDPNWEKPVKAWAAKYISENASEKTILSEIPTEFDDVHTANSANNLPNISIISPESDGDVIAGNLEVYVDIDAPHGVEKVDFYIDQKLVKTATEYPYTGKIRIPRRGETRFRIGATVTDGYYYENSDVIFVNLSDEKDSTPPTVSIVSPDEGAIFPPDTVLTIRTEAIDNIAIDEVQFYLDDRLVGSVKKPPYQYTMSFPDEIAPHTIFVQANDSSGNISRDQVNIKIEENSASEDLSTQFLFPRPDSVVKVEKPLDLFFQISSSDKRNASSIKVVASRQDGETTQEKTIYERDPSSSEARNFSFTWIPDQPGSYSLSIVSEFSGGRSKSSDPLGLKVEN